MTAGPPVLATRVLAVASHVRYCLPQSRGPCYRAGFQWKDTDAMLPRSSQGKRPS